MGPAERSYSGICQLVRRVGGGGNTEQSTEPIVRKRPKFCVSEREQLSYTKRSRPALQQFPPILSSIVCFLSFVVVSLLILFPPSSLSVFPQLCLLFHFCFSLLYLLFSQFSVIFFTLFFLKDPKD